MNYSRILTNEQGNFEEEFGAYPDEIEGMLEDIREILQRSGVYDHDVADTSSPLSGVEVAQ
jgi:hypothetical protein